MPTRWSLLSFVRWKWPLLQKSSSLAIGRACEIAEGHDGLASMPSRHEIESEDALAIEEERRLVYVAATRAKDRLVLTAAQQRLGCATAGCSRFVAEVGL
jgi:superfamily I DNA/RNA helicase